MCDLSEEEFAEYVRWIETAGAAPVPAKVRTVRPKREGETIVTAPPTEATA